VKTMTEVLTAHQRHNSRSCLCGWDALGKSHPQHQEAMLTAAGYGPAGATAVIHVAHDTEAHARSYNEGYDAAVTQGLADDPTLADDWLQDKLRTAAAAGLRSVYDIWGAGGRATIRMGELAAADKTILSGEWDNHIEWNITDIKREQERAARTATIEAAR
jgi:hypothetical protein